MDDQQNNCLSDKNISRNQSFQSLNLSQNDEFEQDEQIIQIPDIQRAPSKGLRQSVKQTYKMYCSNLKTMKTNIAYNLRHSAFQFLTAREKVILNKNQSIILLGKVYENKSKQKEAFYIDFNNIIWLTYRSGIYGVESDAGWGCMIRVCQMVLAQTFKRICPDRNTKQIVDYFRDSPQAYFSLTRICEKGNIVQRWTSSIEIFTLLKFILSQFKEIKLSIDIHSCCLEIQKLKQLDQVLYPTLIFVSNRLGKNKFQDDYTDHLLEVMKIQYFVGAVGGNGGQALYLIGNYSKKIIFMDPHYVQQASVQQQEKDTWTYFQSQPYSIDAKQLAPSVAFCFLVKSKNQYINLLQKLYQLQIKYRPWVCLQIHSQQIKQIMQKRLQNQDQFQIL